MCDVTVVLEWDNPRAYSGTAHEERALAALAVCLRELECSVEVIHVCDVPDASRVRELSARYLTQFERVIVAPGARYYEMKNIGADAARGAIVVLCDTDCELEPGALRQLLAAFDDRSRQVVAGAAYIDPTTFTGRAWSLLTVFPSRSTDDAVELVPSFLANFAAFRRELAMFRFPMHDRMRTQCFELAARLRANGIDIWRANGARTRHAAPEGFAGFLQRALWASYDTVAIHAARPMPRVAAVARSFASVGSYALRRLRRLATRFSAYGIPRAELPLQVIVIVAFTTVEFLLLPLPLLHARVPRWAE